MLTETFEEINNDMPSINSVGYCRFSSDLQREESIDAQQRYIKAYAYQNHYKITKFYCDRAKSGKNMNRPEFQKMLEDSKKGNFQVIIVHKLDRFSRNTVDTLQTIDELKNRGVDVVSAYERIESNAMGKLILSIYSGMGEYYISNLANEVLKGQRENAYHCKANGGVGCLGYNIVDQKYVINEKEAESVRLIFQMYSNGYGYNAIIDKLNSLGYVTKAGKPFGKNSLYNIINNEKYTGTFLFNQIARGDSHGKRNSHRLKKESEIIRIPNGIPAIISKELWNRVQAIRQINPKGKSHNKYFYLLSGLMYCGECGYKMHGNPRSLGKGRPTYITYRCNHKDNNRCCHSKEVRCEYVEAFVIEELFRHFFNNTSIPIITKQLKEKFKQDSMKKSEEYLMYQSTLKMQKKSRNNLMDAMKQSGYQKSLVEELKNVDSQIETCESFLKKFDEQNGNIPVITEEQVSSSLTKLKEFAKTSRREEVRAMIQSYVERVTVYNDRIEVTYKVAFAFADQPVTYHCDSSISRNQLNQICEKGELGVESQKMIDHLHTA